MSGFDNHENYETHEKAQPEFCDSFVYFVPFVVAPFRGVARQLK